MFSRTAQSILFVMVVSLAVLAQAQTAPGQKEQPGNTNIIIDRQLVRFTTQGEAVEWRLVVTSQQGVLVFDSGLVYAASLEWPLLNYLGQPLESGLYAYTLTTKAVTDGAAHTQRGHLILDRASSSDRLWVASSQETALGTGSEITKLTIIGNNETTLGGAELPVSTPRREESGERSQPQRDAPNRQADNRLEDGSRAAPAGPQAVLATAGRLPKFADAAGNLTDSGVLETFAGGNLVQTFGNTAATPGAFNHVVEIVAAAGKTPLTLVGGAGAMEFWKDAANGGFPTKALAFGVAKPATPAVVTDDMVFSAFDGAAWFERMRLTNGGNLGIGTPAPGTKLDIQGSVSSLNGVALKLFNSNAGNTNQWVLGTGGAVVAADAFSIGDTSNYKMTILSNGNVGIGTTAPATILDVRSFVNNGNGVLNATNTAPGGPAIFATGGNSSPAIGGGSGVLALGGTGTNAPGGTGLVSFGGSASAGSGGTGGSLIGGVATNTGNGGDGLFAVGALGTGAGKKGGRGIVAIPGGGSSGAIAGKAGEFLGDVSISGSLSKGSGSFKIDHPLDPENKYLYHSFVESPDMLNIYNGNVTTDEQGEATVTLPDYFGALNRDFRYQLTVIGQFAQAIVAQKIKDNHFTIKTDQPNVEVSWQVTGIRQDAYANAHRIKVEEEKPEQERGYYLHPELHGQPEEKGVEWARNPEMMRQMKERSEQAQRKSQQE